MEKQEFVDKTWERVRDLIQEQQKANYFNSFEESYDRNQDLYSRATEKEFEHFIKLFRDELKLVSKGYIRIDIERRPKHDSRNGKFSMN